MPNSTKQRFRVTAILKILQEETDFEHPISTQDFCARLMKEGISCDRRILSEDISGLVDLGYEISSVPVGKHMNESIMYDVGLINDAITQNKKISFRYYDLDENHKKKYRKDKQRYKESPMALVYYDIIVQILNI